jgi:hypothetical protein
MQRERALISKVGLLGRFSLVKERKERKERKSEISGRDLQKPF